MRPTLVAWALLPLIARAFPFTSSSHLGLEPSSSSLSLSIDILPTATSAQSAVSSVPAEPSGAKEALIVLPCHGCSEQGADEYLPLTFAILPEAHDQNAFETQISFSLNGVHVVLVNVGHTDGQTVKLLFPFNDTIADLSAELFCGSSNTETSSSVSSPSSRCEPVVGLRLNAYHGRRLTAQPGVNITLLSDSHHISTLTLGYADAGTGIPQLTSDTHAITEQDARTYQTLVDAQFETTIADAVQEPPAAENLLNESLSGSSSGLSDLENQQHEKCFARLHRLLDHFAAGAEKALKHTLQVVQTEFTQVSVSAESSSQDIMITSTEKEGTPQSSDKSQYERLDHDNPLVRILEILAGAIGLTALYKFIKSRCCSLRRKVERLADREERKAAQAYRRAARKQAIRQRWEAVRSLFCRPGRNANYEEKRGLILAAAEEEGLLSEKDDAQDELVAFQHAHSIVSRMVQSGRQFWFDPATMPSPIKGVADTRSRASSLPSYHSEELPGYTSSPGSTHEVSDGFRPHSPTSSRASTADTPDSSIPDLSSRNSSETLRSEFDKASD
ncbi:hypothetical protein MBLNU457_g0574t1 [Dothideomycetes sp. NU457]